MRDKGMNGTFRATGQTGILITGNGVPLDAVIADFMAGSVEYLTPDNDADHWDLIEGQGSLFHASYSGVTLALIHGGAPDALILCHEPTREHMRGLPDYQQPSLQELNDVALTWPVLLIRKPEWLVFQSTQLALVRQMPSRCWKKLKKIWVCQRLIRFVRALIDWPKRYKAFNQAPCCNGRT